jgi:hypothetical protein
LEAELQFPKVGMFTTGLWSMTLAAGTPPTTTRLVGSTIRADGTVPNEHRIVAPLTTCLGIIESPAS